MACEVGKKSGECGGLKAKGGTGFNGERITSHVNNAERSGKTANCLMDLATWKSPIILV